jgi:uncharacterized repeat protein (TIGR01451 family)
MQSIRVLFAAMLAFCLVAVGGFVATSASAHTPSVQADCDQLAVSLTGYNAGGTNRVVVTINGDVVDDSTFGTGYSDTFDAPDKYASFHYVVAVTAHDDPNGTEGWTKTFTGDSVACEQPGGGHTPVNVCHATNSDTNPYVFITVDDDSVKFQGHLAHRNTPNKTWKSDGIFRGHPVKAGDAKPDLIGDYTDKNGVLHVYDGVITSKTDCGVLTPPPPPTQPSGQFTVECTATGAQADVGTLSEGDFSGGTFRLVADDFSATVTSGQQNVVVPADDLITLQYVPAQGEAMTLDSDDSPEACPPPPTQPSGQFTVECTATGAQADVGTLSAGDFPGGFFRLVADDFAVTVTSGQQNVVVPADSAIALEYVVNGDDVRSLDSEDSPHACPPPVQPSGQFTTECTATGAQADIGTLSEGRFSEGTFRLVSGAFSVPVTSGQQNVTVPASSTITLQYVPAEGDAQTLDTEQSPAACPPPPSPPTGDVVKTSVPATGAVVAPGATIAYTVTVRNVGQVPIVNAPVVDTLPTFVTAVAGSVSDSGVVSTDGRTITWTVSLAVGATKAFTYTGLVGANAPPTSQLVNKASFLLKESTTTHVVGSGAMTLVKAVSPVAGNGVVVEFGDTLTYTLTATATGNLDQPNVVVTDYVPGYDPARPGSGSTTYVMGSAACIGAGTCTVTGPDANGLITWNLGDMAAGTSRQVTFQVTIDDVTGEDGATVAVDILNAGAVKSDRTPVTPSNEVKTPVTKVLGVKTPNEEQPSAGPVTQPGTLPHTGAGIPLGATVGGGLALLAMGMLLTGVGRRREVAVR